MCIRDRRGPAQAEGQADRGARKTPRPARLRAHRRSGDGRPDADRQDHPCLLYTSDAADERSSVDLGGRRIIKKKKENETTDTNHANPQTRQ